MKNKVIIGIILFFVILFGYCIVSEAAISVQSKQVNSGEQFSVNITSDVGLVAYTIEAKFEGLSFVDSSINSSGAKSGQGTTKVSSASGESSSTNLATYTFKAPNVTKDTTYTITFYATGMGNSDYQPIPNSTCTATITVKAPVQQPEQPQQSEQKPTETVTTPEKTQEPEFSSENNKKVYLTSATNFRSACNTKQESFIETLKSGTELIQIGVSKIKVEGYIWSKVKYGDKIGYVINNNLTTTKPEEEPKADTPVEEPIAEEPEEPTEEVPDDEIDDITTGLKSLEIEGLTLSPAFKPNVYEYRVIVKEDVTSLNISALAFSEDSTVTIAGNTDLVEGENLITIVVYNGNQVEGTYQITVNKNTLDLTKTDKMLFAGNKAATRGMIIFVVLLAISVVALIVVLILKRRNEHAEDDEYEEHINDYDYQNPNINQDYNYDNNQNLEQNENMNQDYPYENYQTKEQEQNMEENTDYKNDEQNDYNQGSVTQVDSMREDFRKRYITPKQDNTQDNLEQENIEPDEKDTDSEERKGKHF